MTPQERIKNNEFLLSLDMSNASSEQKIAWLCQIIKNETEKSSEEQDLDLIAECSEYMLELSKEDAIVSAEKKKQALAEVKSKYPAVKKKRPVMTKKPKMLRKIVAILAAVILLTFSTLTVAAKVEGYSNALDFVVANIQRILNMEQGESLDEGGITFVKGGKGVSYDSMDELVYMEGLDILYPAGLPEGVQITKITQQIAGENSLLYVFVFDDANLSIVVSPDWTINPDDLASYDIYSVQGHNFYLKCFSNGTCQAIGYDEKYEYNIMCSNYNDLKLILDNMKG